MALTLDTTLQGITANSYCSVNYADAYFFDHYDSVRSAAWSNLAFGQKVNALIAATRVLETARFTNPVTIDEYALYYDRRSGMILQLDTTRDAVKSLYQQLLQFPRNLDRNFTTGAFFIPEGILIAQCEQAVYLLSYDESAVANRTMGIVNNTIGLGGNDIHINQEYVSEGSAFAPMALEYSRQFMLKIGARFRRG